MINVHSCDACPAKSADCAYGDLRGSQSCIDALAKGSTLPVETNDARAFEEDARSPWVIGTWWHMSDEDGKDWLCCVYRVGSNFIELRGKGGSYLRLLFGEAAEKLRPEPSGEETIDGYVAESRRRLQSYLDEVRALTASLGVDESALRIGDSSQEAAQTTRSLVALPGRQGIKTYQDALVVAKDTTLPNLFSKIKKENENMASWMKMRLLPVEAKIEPLEGIIGTIKDRIFNVELYAGLTEEAICCREGATAPSSEKLRVMQRKLFMDEECLLDYHAGGMEFKNIERFDAWVSQDKNRDRLLPFPRCLVAMQVRRYVKDRDWEGDPLKLFINFEIERSDKLTFLYIRNGDQVWRLSCGLEFGDLIFPDTATLRPDEPKMVKMSFDRVERIMGLAEFDTIKNAREEKQRLMNEWESEHPDESGIRNPHYFFDDFHLSNWHPLDQSSVYYDEGVAYLEDSFKKYNRIALLIQGIFDRSPMLHPHPPVKTWTEEGFASAVELVRDGPTTLYEHAEAPDFEAYRKELNSTIAVGCVAVGQEDFWLRKEAEKECARRDNDYRDKSNYRPTRYHPYGDPGPGMLAEVDAMQPKKGAAVFRWQREKIRYSPYGGLVDRRLIVPTSELLNVSAYRRGDYLRFFNDPRTRAGYLRWAPMLLAAEDYVSGKRSLR